MNNYYKLYFGIFVFWVIAIILSFFIDWTVTNNGFVLIAMWLICFLSGLVCGRELTLKDVRK